jgi:hypothetical protein
MIALKKERRKSKKTLDDCDNRTHWKLMRKRYGTSWPEGGSGYSGLRVITAAEIEPQEER